jgi:hemerythrin-like domain-containing protein
MPAELRRMALMLAEEIPTEYLATPLEFIFADNFRCRVLCNLLSVIGSGREVDPDIVSACQSFLLRDFLVHLADEKQALFPLLIERTSSNDAAYAVVRQERPGFAAINRLASALERHQRGTGHLSVLLNGFISKERHHIAIENVVLLPLARKRLRPSDLTWLTAVMRDHRGRVRRAELPS